MSVNILLNLPLLIILFKAFTSYIILPFKSTNIQFYDSNNISMIENFLSQINTNQLYTTLSFGTPPKNIDFYLTMEQLPFSILSNNCINGSESSYNPFFSKTFLKQTSFNYTYEPISEACLATDKCTFYNNRQLSNNITFDTLKFFFGNNSSPKIDNIESERLCGTIGLNRYSYITFLTINNFIYYLKSNKIINSYQWGIFYFDKENSYNIDQNTQSKYDGLLIVGITNDTYLDIFKTDNIIASYVYSSYYWSYSFTKIFYNNSENEFNCGNYTPVNFVIDMNYISTTRIYYESIKKYFFKIYLDEEICVEEKVYIKDEGNNYMIICNLEIKKDLSSFPKIYFYSEKFSYIFNLDYNDIFIELNGKIYFLIVFKEEFNTIWKIGKIFMKKYPLIFDYAQKTISFVRLEKFGEIPHENKGGENNNNIFLNFKVYIFIFLLIIAIIIGVFIGKIIWKNQRKKRANELDDNYDYIEKIDINK